MKDKKEEMWVICSSCGATFPEDMMNSDALNMLVEENRRLIAENEKLRNERDNACNLADRLRTREIVARRLRDKLNARIAQLESRATTTA